MIKVMTHPLALTLTVRARRACRLALTFGPWVFRLTPVSGVIPMEVVLTPLLANEPINYD